MGLEIPFLNFGKTVLLAIQTIFRRNRMIRKAMILALGLSLVAVSFCKKEEPVVEEKMETVDEAAKAAAGTVEKEVNAAVKKVEAEATKAVTTGTKAATDAAKDATKQIPKPGM